MVAVTLNTYCRVVVMGASAAVVLAVAKLLFLLYLRLTPYRCQVGDHPRMRFALVNILILGMVV